MGIKCGIVGLPNVGKSTIFNALTNSNVQADNYPFCTIEPNSGIVPIPDARLNKIAAIVKTSKIIPATINFVDIAGLVAGAVHGQGLGNQFLGHIRETDAIIHVVRCFDDERTIHVSGKVDPISDIEIVNTELLLADLSTVDKILLRAKKLGKLEQKSLINILEIIRSNLDQGNMIRNLDLSTNERHLISNLFLLTAKPVLYIANINTEVKTVNKLLDPVLTIAKKENTEVVALDAAIEYEIANLDDQEKFAFLTQYNLEESGLIRVTQKAKKLLGLYTYFTAGPKEVRAWTINAGSNAVQAARVIHTDFEKGFIRAEVISYHDYIRYGGESGARAAGSWRLEGRDYIINDGDIIHFRFNI